MLFWAIFNNLGYNQNWTYKCPNIYALIGIEFYLQFKKNNIKIFSFIIFHF